MQNNYSYRCRVPIGTGFDKTVEMKDVNGKVHRSFFFKAKPCLNYCKTGLQTLENRLVLRSVGLVVAFSLDQVFCPPDDPVYLQRSLFLSSR